MRLIHGRLRPAIAFAALGLGAARVAPAQAKEPFPGLDSYIAKAVHDWKIPGVAVAIVRNDSVLFTKGYGTIAPGGGAPVNDQTLFEIGSSTKAFTSTLVAMMVTDGKMRWTDHVSDFLPGFRMYDPVANEGATIRDALTHQTGIARGELVWLSSGLNRDEVLHRLRFLKPESPFRSKYSYQNMMFLAAGEAAAKAAGSNWDDLIKQRIFLPLGMTSSVTNRHGLTNTNVAKPNRMDHDTPVEQNEFNAENIAPAGSIMSSAKDMAQWLRFQLNDGTVNGKRLVSSAALKETHSPQILTAPGAGRGGGPGADTLPPVTLFSTYGMGWFIEDYRHNLMWQHGGNTPGMTTAVGMLPEHKFGVVVLSSMQSASLPALVMNYIFDRELNAPMRDWSGDAYTRSLTARKRADSVEKAQAVEHPMNAKPPLPLAAYAGTFADSLYGDATVVVKDDHLVFTRGDWTAPLQYWNATNFRWSVPGSPAGPMNIKFEVSPDNTVTGLWFGIGGDITLLSRKGNGRGGRGGRGGGR